MVLAKVISARLSLISPPLGSRCIGRTSAPKILIIVLASPFIVMRHPIPTLKTPVAWLLAATIFAWTGALRKKGEIDRLPALTEFANKLETAAKETIEIDRIMTGDLAKISEPPAKNVATTEEFIDAVGSRLKNAF